MKWTIRDILGSGKVERIYQSWLKGPAEKTGLHKHIKNIYSEIMDRSSSPVSIDIGGNTVILHPKNNYERKRIFNQLRERDVIENITEQIKDDDVFWDVGANYGLYSTVIASQGIETIAFEPDPINVDRIRKNAEENNLHIEIEEYGLSDSNQSAALNSEVVTNSTDPDDSTRIELYRGSEIIQKFSVPSPDVMKIDIEGEELAALNGLEPELSEGDCRLIYCEIHPLDRGESIDYGLSEDEIQEVFDIFERNGFITERISQRDEQFYIRARRSI